MPCHSQNKKLAIKVTEHCYVERWNIRHVTRVEQRKNIETSTEIDPCPLKHLAGASSTWLQKALAEQSHLLGSYTPYVLHTGRISKVRLHSHATLNEVNSNCSLKQFTGIKKINGREIMLKNHLVWLQFELKETVKLPRS